MYCSYVYMYVHTCLQKHTCTHWSWTQNGRDPWNHGEKEETAKNVCERATEKNNAAGLGVITATLSINFILYSSTYQGMNFSA